MAVGIGNTNYVYANPATSLQDGMQTGNALQMQGMQVQQAQQGIQDQNALRTALSQGLTGSASDQQNALSTLAQQAPTQVGSYLQSVGQMSAQQQAQLQQSNQQIFRTVQDIVAQPPQNRQAAYDAAVAKLKSDGGNVTGLEGAPWNVGVKLAVNHVQSVSDLLSSGGYGPQEGTVVSPGGVLVDKNTGTKLFSNPANGQFQNINTGQVDANGNAIQQQGLINPQSGTVTPLSMGGGSSASFQTQITPTSPTNNGAAAQANALLAKGMQPDQIMQQVISANPGQKVALSIDPQSGQFVDAIPDAMSNAAQGGGVGTSVGIGGGEQFVGSTPPLALGQSVKTPAKASVPSGYRLSADGQSLEAIPGGPADKGGAIAPLGDTTKSGADYLQTLGDPSLQAQIQGIAEGRFPLPKVSRPSKQGEISPQQLQQAVAQYDPTYDQADPTSRIKARNDFTSGKSAVQLRQLNTLLGHLGGLSDAADKLNNGNYSTLNSVENAFGQGTGSTKTTNFNAAAGPAAEEFAALLKGGVPSVEEIKSAQSRLNSNMSPDQLHGSIGTMAAQVQSRIAALQSQAKNSLGPFANKVQIITPEGQAALDKLRTKGLIGKFDLGEEGTGAKPDASQPGPQPQGGWSIQRVQ